LRYENATKQQRNKKESPIMKMQKLKLMAVLATGAVLAFAPYVPAQETPQRPNRPERPAGGERPERPGGGQRAGQPGDMIKEMEEKLALTAEQKTKLQEAVKAQRETAQGLRDLPPEERRTKMQENRQAMQAKIKEILTAEQFTKWEKIRSEARPGGGNRPGGPGGPGAGGPDGNRRGPGGPDGERPPRN
jgi:Spy/CpxP family protein refolding chaperone